MAENYIPTLKDLIEVCRDGQNGYLHASVHVEDPELRSFFSEQSLERARFARDLEDEVEKLGTPAPDTNGSIAAVLHRAWFELKADLGGGDQAVINSVEQGEDRAKQVYQDALHADLPAPVLNLISHQYESVRAAHDRVRDIRDAGQERAA
jgi:uncharacterized protein (TIGR02284 family)